jgi:hypothetical protein
MTANDVTLSSPAAVGMALSGGGNKPVIVRVVVDAHFLRLRRIVEPHARTTPAAEEVIRILPPVKTIRCSQKSRDLVPSTQRAGWRLLTWIRRCPADGMLYNRY